VTVNDVVPAAVEPVVATVKVVVLLPLDVMGFGENEPDAPEGRPPTLNVTVQLPPVSVVVTW
jgi:hypothetical protein